MAPTHTTDETRLTAAGLRQAAGALLDEVLTDPTRGELEVLMHVCSRVLAARAARLERAA